MEMPSGLYTFQGTTTHRFTLMLRDLGPDVRVEAVGGVRTLDNTLLAMSLDVAGIGTSSTAKIMQEATRRSSGFAKACRLMEWKYEASASKLVSLKGSAQVIRDG